MSHTSIRPNTMDNKSVTSSPSQQNTDKRSYASIEQSFFSLIVILTTFSGIVLARVFLSSRFASRLHSFQCYLLEFLLIMMPGILFVTVAYRYSLLFVLLLTGCLLLYMLRSRVLLRIRNRSQFDMGSRPFALTVLRALTQMITAICILAIDFKSFHRPYRKSRFYGAQLMDTGIGLFVVTMGLVSRLMRNFTDLRRSIIHSAMPLILLGFIRVGTIILVGYGQDDHEYGRHLNAFFTLGLTKLFGSILIYFVHSERQLLHLALGVLACHQIALSFGGISEYVRDDDIPRSTFLSANREGLLSLPGFVAIYFLSICFARWLLDKTSLSYEEMTGKMRRLFMGTTLCWASMVASAFIVGISRVTCNLGYVLWLFAILGTMAWLTILIFVLIIDDNWPRIDQLSETELGSSSPLEGTVTKDRLGVFIICDALNMNGLVFFLLANILTGCVNVFLKPEERSDSTSVIILIVYMFLVTTTVCQLYKRRIRIA